MEEVPTTDPTVETEEGNQGHLERVPSNISSNSVEDQDEARDKVFNLFPESFTRNLPRQKYKTKKRATITIQHANTVGTMPDYERQKKLEQDELKRGRFNLRRVDAASMIV